MYRVTAYFRDRKISKKFHNVFDAIEYRDDVDAHYPIKVIFKKVRSMREWVYDCWNVVMNHDKNPLSQIPDLRTRHTIMQLLAWMWCIVFGIITGSWTAFGISTVAHVALLGAIAITVGTFETARNKPQYFGGYGRGPGGEHE